MDVVEQPGDAITVIDHVRDWRGTNGGTRMQCERCRFENKASARFCAACGIMLATRCAACGSDQDPTAKFCDQCGTPLAARPPPAAPGHAVRKQVTALFADLAGSTAFAEQVDPEAARAALAPYFEILRSSIEHHAGTVVKFTGDGVMAVFGLPEVAEDDALRAVAAGQELQRRFTAFADDIRDHHGVELGLRVGINSGELVVGDGDADLVGDVLNTAARLEAACTPGRIMVGEDTWRSTRSTISYEVLGEIRVKGKSDALATFEVAESDSPSVEHAMPFVGRADEMSQLLAAFDATRDSSAARLVTVIGPPGVGKTRLALELRTATAVRSFDLRFERRGSTTFSPIAELLRDVTDGTADGVVRLFAGHDEQHRLVPILHSFLGHGATSSTEQAFWAVRRLLEHLAQRHGPIIVVVDDIQWAEPLFWDLLDHLVEWADAPVLTVALARPELRELRPQLAQPGRRVSAAIALEGLDDSATRELAARLLDTDELPAELIERLPASTEGNPLFVRELVHMLVEDGTLACDGDRWRLTIDADAIDVPPTILSLLASRVERLPVDERQVIELASVIGTEFDRGTLTAIAGSEIGSRLGALIDRLRRKDLVEPTGAWAGDHPVYRFHHVLVRDAAYRRLLKGRRADLHELVGRHAEHGRGVGEELDVMVAHHFEQVVHYRRELGTADHATHELAGIAVDRLRRAADSALEREDLPSAGGYALRALALATPAGSGREAGRDELLVLGCEALLSSGDVASATPLVRELHERSSDERLVAWADCFRAQRWSLTDSDRLSEAAGLADDAAGRLDALDDQSGVAKGRLVRASCLARLGRIGECESELDLALGAARAAGDRRRTVAVLGQAPLAALWGPSPVARAGGRCLDVLRLLRITTASPAVEATSLRCQGMLEALRGRFGPARDKLDASRQMARELGLRHGLFETELFAGFIEMWAGDPIAAEPHLRAAREGLGRLGIGADAGQAGALLARARLRQGDVDGADALAAEAVDSAGQNLQTAMRSRAILAEIRASQGRHDEARVLIDQAIEVAERTDVVLDHAIVLLTAARVADHAADGETAHHLRARAHQLLDDKGAIAPRAATDEAPLDGSNPRDSAPSPTAGARKDPWNRAVAIICEVYDAALDGDRGGVVRRLAPDATIAGRSAVAWADELVADLSRRPRHEVRLEPIATRMDDLAVVRLGTGTVESVRFVVVECDGEVMTGMTSFDESRRLDASDLLDRRWAATGGPAEWVDLAVRTRRALANQDAAALRELCEPGLRAVDHRSIGPGDRDLDQFIAHTMTPETSGENTTNVSVEEILDHTATSALEVMSVGTPDARTQLLVIVDVADGRLRWFETFDRDDEDHARRRFDEITGRADPVDLRPRNRAMQLLRDSEIEIEPIAVRADHLALARITRSVDADATGALIGAESRGDEIVSSVTFSADQPIDALDWLDARWAETGGPTDLLGHMIATRNAIADGDTDGFRALCHPDMQLIDHRRIGPGNVTLDDFVTISVAPELRGRRTPNVYVESSLEHTDRAALHVFAIGPPEARTTVLTVVELTDGLLSLYESFDLDDLDAARRRFRDVLAARTSELHHELESLTDRFVAHFFDDTFDEIRDELFEPDFVREDRRHWVSFPDSDLDGSRAAALAFDTGVPTFRRGPLLAVRPNCYLGPAETVYPHGDADEQLVVVVAGPTGRIGRMIVFDPDDVNDAEDELDRQWVLAGGPERVADTFARMRRAATRADREALGSFHSPDFRSVDHRRLGLGVRDLDEWVEMMAMIGAGTWIVNAEVLGHCDCATATRTTMTSPDRTSRWEFVNLFQQTPPDGPITRQDVYGLDQRDEAMARFAEVCAAGDGDSDVGSEAASEVASDEAARRPANAASRLLQRTSEAVLACDRDELERILHPDLVSERQTGADGALRVTVTSRAELIEDVLATTARSGANTPLDSQQDVVAIRGDDLCLSRGGPEPGDGDRDDLVLVERSDGRLSRITRFAPDRLHDALDELDRRWFADAAPEGLLDANHRFRRIFATGTFDELDRLLTPSFEAFDHRQLGFGRRTRAEYLESARVVVGCADGLVRRIHQVADGTWLIDGALYLHGDGGWTIMEGVSITTARRDGRLERWETFDAEQLDLARRRFDEIVGEDRVGNEAFRLARRLAVAWEHGDVELARALLHDDASIVDDERTEADLAGSRDLAVGHRPIAIRDADLCIVRVDEIDEECGSLYLVERDAGRIRTMTRFGLDELLDAENALDRRWAERGGSSGYADFLIRYRTVLRDGTIDEFDALIAPDFVSIDHRQIGLGIRDRTTWIESMHEFIGNSTLTIPNVLEVRGRTVLDLTSFNIGGEWAILDSHPLVVTFDQAWRTTRIELFDADDVEWARRRFEELVSEPDEGDAVTAEPQRVS